MRTMSGGDGDDDGGGGGGGQAAPPLKVSGLPLCWIQSTEPPLSRWESADVPPSLGQAGWLRDFLETIDCSSPAIRLLQVPLIPSHYPPPWIRPHVSPPLSPSLPAQLCFCKLTGLGFNVSTRTGLFIHSTHKSSSAVHSSIWGHRHSYCMCIVMIDRMA